MAWQDRGWLCVCGALRGHSCVCSLAPCFLAKPVSQPRPPRPPSSPPPPGALQRSLAARRAATDDPGTAEVLTLLATKPMQLAQYFCTAGRDRAAWAHYALAVQLYTHFTSPIRWAGLRC